MDKEENAVVPTLEDDLIRSRIFTIRGVQVMLDRDLAELYGVSTGALNQAGRRNKSRFPERFIFQLNKEELDNLKSQSVISSSADASSARIFSTPWTWRGSTPNTTIRSWSRRRPASTTASSSSDVQRSSMSVYRSTTSARGASPSPQWTSPTSPTSWRRYDMEISRGRVGA